MQLRCLMLPRLVLFYATGMFFPARNVAEVSISSLRGIKLLEKDFMRKGGDDLLLFRKVYNVVGILLIFFLLISQLFQKAIRCECLAP